MSNEIKPTYELATGKYGYYFLKDGEGMGLDDVLTELNYNPSKTALKATVKHLQDIIDSKKRNWNNQAKCIRDYEAENTQLKVKADKYDEMVKLANGNVTGCGTCNAIKELAIQGEGN